MGASEYVNPLGGAELFDEAKFARSGVALTLQRPVDYTYACGAREFVPRLSILDVLMWNAPEQVKAFLDVLKQADGPAQTAGG